jgi:hypothetical protein
LSTSPILEPEVAVAAVVFVELASTDVAVLVAVVMILCLVFSRICVAPSFIAPVSPPIVLIPTSTRNSPICSIVAFPAPPDGPPLPSPHPLASPIGFPLVVWYSLGTNQSRQSPVPGPWKKHRPLQEHELANKITSRKEQYIHGLFNKYVRPRRRIRWRGLRLRGSGRRRRGRYLSRHELVRGLGEDVERGGC